MKQVLVICLLIISGCSTKDDKVTIKDLGTSKPDASVTEVIEEKIS